MKRNRTQRRGIVIMMIALVLVFLVVVTAFAVDSGWITRTRAELQRAGDSAALAGAAQLPLPPGTTDQTVQREQARQTAIRFAALHGAGEKGSLVLRSEDTQTGYVADVSTPNLDEAAPFHNVVRVRLRRDEVANGQLPLFFAPVVGITHRPVVAQATAAVQKGYGLLPGAKLLPYALNIDIWLALTTGTFADGLLPEDVSFIDEKTWNRSELSISDGSDGMMEAKLFVYRNQPGNFGTLDLGSSSNGTPDLARQILDGPTAADFANPDFSQNVAGDGALYVPFSTTGDAGISGGGAIVDAFTAILGIPRVIPLFEVVSGSGENAVYRIVGYAAIVVTDVDLNGNPKIVRIQPAPYVDSAVTSVRPDDGTSGIVIDGVWTLRLIQ